MVKVIKSFKEILREMKVSTPAHYNADGEISNQTEYYIVDTDEDHVINAMMVYEEQFSKTEESSTEQLW